MFRAAWAFAVLSLLMAADTGQVPSEKPSPRPSDQAQTRERRNVAILVYEGAELLDLAGPAEVLTLAGQFGPRASHDGAFNVYTVGRSSDPVVIQGFLTITPQYTFRDSPRPDVLVVPGGGGHGAGAADPETLKWLAGVSRTAQAILGVCTGAFPLAKAGLLDGLRATTWSTAIPHLRHEAPGVRVEENVRVVDAGKVVTTGAVSTGIDGAPHVVARLLGEQEARWVAESMEYRWSP